MLYNTKRCAYKLTEDANVCDTIFRFSVPCYHAKSLFLLVDEEFQEQIFSLSKDWVNSKWGFNFGYTCSFQVKHSLVKQTETDGSIDHVHILEIAGALLPHHVHRIRKVLERTQGEFTLTFNTHEPTVPFNAKLSTTDNNPEREKMNMKGDNFDSFFDNCEIEDRLTCIRELYCKKCVYNWATWIYNDREIGF